MKLTLKEMVTALTASVSTEADVTVTSTTFDSRKATAGSLFIPLVAENDGHDYIASAIANGATAT